MPKPVFKPYVQNQLSLLPPSLDDLIAENHVVRIVSDVVNRIDIDALLKKYKGGGTSSYHPRMMLKILVYGYLSNTYSSRKLEQAVASNIHYMWLAGMQTPDHNTINTFRSSRLQGILKEVFSQVVMLMVESGYVNIKRICIDGTKLEANANKYSFVWGRSIVSNKKRIHRQLNELWKYAQQVAKEELKDNDPTTYESIDKEKLTKTIDSINEALKDRPIDNKVKQKLKYAEQHWPKNLDKYVEQQKVLEGRNSYSKTDPDATFMRMKDDPMQNGQLKPAYNWQLSTSNQYIVNYDLYPNPTDTLTLPHHIESYKTIYNQYPDEAIADAGYGSHRNYEFLEQNHIEAYIKYPGFHKEQKLKNKPDQKQPFAKQYLHYNSDQDFYVCPMGQQMHKIGIQERTSTNHKAVYHLYQAQNCNRCPLRASCHNSTGNRVVQVSHQLNRLRNKAKQKLLSPTGIQYRKQRPQDVESVFGHIKHNKKFKRFNLRGVKKTKVEIGLLAIAHNIAKMAK